MNRQLNHRLAAAFASVAITFCLVSGVANLAKPSADATLMAQAGVTVAMR